jgi:hypothetical protein
MTRQRYYKVLLLTDEDSISDFLNINSIYNDGTETDLFLLSNKLYLKTNSSFLLEKLNKKFLDKVHSVDNDFDLSSGETIFTNYK